MDVHLLRCGDADEQVQAAKNIDVPRAVGKQGIIRDSLHPSRDEVSKDRPYESPEPDDHDVLHEISFVAC